MKLPKYYVVPLDGKHPNIKIVLEHFNHLCDEFDEMYWFNSNNKDFGYEYIGYDGNEEYESGTCIYDDLEDFQNNPVLLSIDEFISMLDNIDNDDYSIF